MLDYVYHMLSKLFKSENVKILHVLRNVVMDVITLRLILKICKPLVVYQCYDMNLSILSRSFKI